MDAALLRGHRSHHLGWGKVRVESLPRLDFPWMAAPMPSICPGCCMQTEPLFVPPKKATQASGCLQPLPSPAANSCRHKARVLGSTCCHHSCRETLISGRGCVWKDIASNVRFAKLAGGQGLWAGMGRHWAGMEIQDPWDAEQVTAVNEAHGSQLVPAGLPGRRLSLAGPELCREARLGKPLALCACCPLCQQSWDWGA